MPRTHTRTCTCGVWQPGREAPAGRRGQDAGGRSAGAWSRAGRSPGLQAAPRFWGSSWQTTTQPLRHGGQAAGRRADPSALGLRWRVVGQRRQGREAAPPPGARLRVHAPLLFVFTQNGFGFFCIPQRVLSVHFPQPPPVLKTWRTDPKCHRSAPTFCFTVQKRLRGPGQGVASQCQARELPSQPKDVTPNQTKAPAGQSQGSCCLQLRGSRQKQEEKCPPAVPLTVAAESWGKHGESCFAVLGHAQKEEEPVLIQRKT